MLGVRNILLSIIGDQVTASFSIVILVGGITVNTFCFIVALCEYKREIPLHLTVMVDVSIILSGYFRYRPLTLAMSDVMKTWLKWA